MKVFLSGVGYLLLNETGYVHGTESFWSPGMRLCLPGSSTMLVAQLAPCVDAGSILAADSESRMERAASSTTYSQPWRPRTPSHSHLVFFHSDKPGL